jgi:hypothetical protein
LKKENDHQQLSVGRFSSVAKEACLAKTGFSEKPGKA